MAGIVFEFEEFVEANDGLVGWRVVREEVWIDAVITKGATSALAFLRGVSMMYEKGGRFKAVRPAGEGDYVFVPPPQARGHFPLM